MFFLSKVLMKIRKTFPSIFVETFTPLTTTKIKLFKHIPRSGSSKYTRNDKI